MYIPELDALVFLSELLDGRPEQPTLQEGIAALYATAGAKPEGRRRTMLPENLLRRRCEAQLRELHIICETASDGDVAELFEALGAGRGVPVLAFGLLLVFVCKATFQQRLHLAFWLLDRDEDGFVNKTDVTRAVEPLMSAAQAGLVLMGTLSDEKTPWDSFKDSVRELATDKVAAAIAAGAFDEADEGQHNRLNAQQFRLMVECIAADVATLLVDMTDLEGQVEHFHSQLAPPGAAKAGVPVVLRRLVRKYAGEEATEQLLGPPPPERRRPSLRGADGSELRLQRSSSGVPSRPRLSTTAAQTPRSVPSPQSTGAGAAPPAEASSFASRDQPQTGLPSRDPQPSRSTSHSHPLASDPASPPAVEQYPARQSVMSTPQEQPTALRLQPSAADPSPGNSGSQQVSGLAAWPSSAPSEAAMALSAHPGPPTPFATQATGPTAGQFPRQMDTDDRYASGVTRQGWFEGTTHNFGDTPRPGSGQNISGDQADLERHASHPQARASRPGTRGRPPQSPNGLSEGLGAQVQFAEERMQREVEEHARRVRAAEKAAAAAEEALKEEMYALEEDHSFARIDPRRALVALIVGLGARWYLMQFVKLMVVLCVLLGDAALVVGLYRGQHLSLELSLGIAFFVDLILMAAALAFIASGVNTDIFTWGKEAFASLKSDDSEKGKECSGNTVAKLAAMESAVPEQYRPIFRSIVGKLTKAEEKMRGKKKQGSRQGSADMSKRSPSVREGSQCSEEQGLTDDLGHDGEPHKSGSWHRRLSRRSRQSRNSDLQMIEGSEGSEQQKGMMGRARQLWSVVGKFAGFEGSRKRLGTADGERSFGHQGGPRLPLGKSRLSAVTSAQDYEATQLYMHRETSLSDAEEGIAGPSRRDTCTSADIARDYAGL